jgi:hypothetical protein
MILCRTPALSKFFDFLSFGQINLGARVEHKMKTISADVETLNKFISNK